MYWRELPLKTTRLTRVALLISSLFLVDKVLAILRQVLVARQFGLSRELDAFNVANNVPDLLFALISGGALAIAFIPVLTEVLTNSGRAPAWALFSHIANLAFLITSGLSVLVAIFAEPLVKASIGIAPGFTSAQQDLVVQLMRLNLIATVIFSISGLVMAGLQSNQHFLLPALAPVFYNLGQIFGVVVLSPAKGYTLGALTLPAYNLGVRGLVYGVIIGAVLHLLIQVPGLIKFQFRWSPGLGLRMPAERRVLRLMGPRVLTIFFIQLSFLIRDNLASRLASGSVTTLTYGWMLQQVPETLIGTAIGTALLPTLAELFTTHQIEEFRATIERAARVLIALCVPVAVALAIGLRPLLILAFNFGASGTDLLVWVTAAFMGGLLGHSLKEVAARAFYARQNALVPLLTAGLNAALYILLGSLLYRPLGAPGIALTDSIVFTFEAVLLFILLGRRISLSMHLTSTFVRVALAAILAGLVTWGSLVFLEPRVHPVLAGGVSMLAGLAVSLPWMQKEIRLLLHL
jgi:putative peptidoglycan lipid II flippase